MYNRKVDEMILELILAVFFVVGEKLNATRLLQPPLFRPWLTLVQRQTKPSDMHHRVLVSTAEK